MLFDQSGSTVLFENITVLEVTLIAARYKQSRFVTMLFSAFRVLTETAIMRYIFDPLAIAYQRVLDSVRIRVSDAHAGY
jgi:hypothetical protein